MNTRIMNLGYDCKVIIPDTVTPKELQALIGFLGTLRKVSTLSNWNGPEFAYTGNYVNVQLEEVHLQTQEDARRLSQESKEAYNAREAKQNAVA